jgi:hypothetical protein
MRRVMPGRNRRSAMRLIDQELHQRDRVGAEDVVARREAPTMNPAIPNALAQHRTWLVLQAADCIDKIERLIDRYGNG